MACHITRCSVGAAACTAALGLLLLGLAHQGSNPAVAVTGAIGALAAAYSVVGLLRGQRFEARLTAVILAAVSGVLALVEMVLGPPGSSAAGVSPRGLLVVVASLATLVLLDRAAHHRGARAFSTRIYAQ
ncbi:hypothetical protein GCM10022415_07230 [Knoellia locipacati]|uniref:Uncharacterized protein n=1 Tax=Knoellia locipacati TaxID=882824 RepID=A0A512SXN4_9MICO|nr:hypothetical protein [Knoellia locipacati]GEQ12674.1 hypothetical protein KLO01_07210 [Knoellia locipacati]